MFLVVGEDEAGLDHVRDLTGGAQQGEGVLAARCDVDLREDGAEVEVDEGPCV